MDGTVGTFNNSGTIKSNDSYGVYINDTVGSFTNSGTISAYNSAVYIDSDVTNFTNSGTLTSQFDYGVDISGDVSGSFINSGKIDGYNYGVYIDGTVGSFNNSGTINGRFDTGAYLNGDVATFTNSGTISAGEYYGVYIGGNVGTFTNSGTITNAYEDEAVYISGTVGTFTNSGNIISNASEAVYFGSHVGAFTNSGTITASESTAVYFGKGGVGSFTNSGTITGAADEYGVYSRGVVGSFTNSGTISGKTGVYFANSASVNLINSGTIIGNGGTAVRFGSGDDTLTLKTGANFIGGVNFGGGNDMLDISGFHGSMTLEEFGTLPGGNVVTGSNLYAQSATQVAIVDTGAIQNAARSISDLVGGVSDLIDVEAGVVGDSGPDSALSGYAPMHKPTLAEAATTSVLVAPTDRKVWAAAIGGGSKVTDGQDVQDMYGALVAGTHAELMKGTTLGVLGGYVRSSLDIGNGNQKVTSDTGIIGGYGETDLGNMRLFYDLIGGVSTNSSSRIVSTMGGSETARATFAGWFIAPEVGLSIPVLKVSNGDFNVAGKIGYIGGGMAAYTETGSSQDMSVAAQTIGLLNTSLELNSKMQVGSAGTGPMFLKGMVGVFTQTNAYQIL